MHTDGQLEGYEGGTAVEDSDLHDLDDAEATTAALEQERREDQTEAEALQELFTGNEAGFKGLMKLSLLESMRWRLGWRPSAARCAERVMAFIDVNSNDQVSMRALDILVRHLEGEFHVSKETLDVFEVRPPRCALSPAAGLLSALAAR